MPDPLQSLQSQAAKTKGALDMAQAKVARAAENRRLAEQNLTVAATRGDTAAAKKAQRLIDEATASLRDGTLAIDTLRDNYRDILRDPLLRSLDAPADIPLLLLPLRLETRFSPDGRVLKVRIYPDDIHIDGLDRGMTDKEEAAGQAYWTGLWQGGEPAQEAAWSTLKHATGPRRAAWIARALRPQNWENRAQDGGPVFPPATAPQRQAALARLLPAYFHVTASQGGLISKAITSHVAPEVKIGLISDDTSALVDKDGLRMLSGTEWLVDFEAATTMGLAVELPLASPGKTIDTLYAYGVCTNLGPAEGAAGFTALLEAQACTNGLAFVPQGTPTNNTEADHAGWQRRIEPNPEPATPITPHPQSNAAVLSDALGLGPADWLASVDHGQDREQGAAAAMMGAMWPATWGYFLTDLDREQSALSPAIIEKLRVFNADHVRGRGPIPSLRIGDQPYGILPVTPYSIFAARPRDSFEAALSAVLNRIHPIWINSATKIPHVGDKWPENGIPDYMRDRAVSYGVRARQCISENFVKVYQKMSNSDPTPIANEALVTKLLNELWGDSAYSYGPATRGGAANPVLLPYADPTRDAGFIRALLEGGKTNTISSVFQALLKISWDRCVAAAAVPNGLNDLIADTKAVSAAMREQIIGAVSARSDVSSGALRAILTDLPMEASAVANPTLMAAKYLVETARAAPSDVEKTHLGLGALWHTINRSVDLATLREALTALLDLPETTKDTDFSLLMADAMDTAAHRLDAWITGLAHQRLAQMRKVNPKGLSIGAYGWVENLRPQSRGKPNGGYVAAPSMAQATTAGILRSAFLNHNASDGDSAFAIDLSSARVRAALDLLNGIREGQPLGALLGYRFERQLKDKCGRFILSFRELAPLTQGQLTEVGTDKPIGAVQSIAAANVTDGLVLMEKWKAEGSAVILGRLDSIPTGNAYFNIGGTWQGPDAAEKKIISDAVDGIIDAADAVADLLLAESVHQVAQGNPRRASAVMDAAGKGEAPPPAPDMISTRSAPAMMTHRVLSILPDQGGWSASAPRSLLAPALEHWAGRRLGDPKRVVLAKGMDGGTLTLADAGIAALDMVALSPDPAALERFVRARIAQLETATPLVQAGDALLGPNDVAMADAILIAQSVQALMAAAKPADVLSFSLPTTPGWAVAPGAFAAALARIQTVLGILDTRLNDLQMLLMQTSVDRIALTKALMDLAEFGIVLPPLGDRPDAEIAFLALNEGRSRQSRVQAELAKGVARPDQLDEVAKIIFGRDFALPLPMRFDATQPDALLGNRPIAPLGEGAIPQFMADWAAVRPALSTHAKAATLTAITGHAPLTYVEQLCGLGQVLADHWLGAPPPAGTEAPTAPVIGLILETAGNKLDLSADTIAALAIDEWTETLPDRSRHGEKPTDPIDTRVTAGVALNADAPNTQPPQVFLLAVPPDTARWSEDSIIALLDDTRKLARTRMVNLERLQLVANILPAIYTQSWSLQGEKMVNWATIHQDIKSLLKSSDLQHFTMVKEV